MNRRALSTVGIAILLSAGACWAQPPRGRILLTDFQQVNDPESGEPETSFQNLGALTEVTFNATENWVLDLKLDSSVTRHIVFLDYFTDNGTEFTPSPARARAFKDAIAAETGQFQLLIDGTGESRFFTDTFQEFGSGMYDEYLQNPSQIYLSTFDIRIKDQASGKVLLLDEYIDQYGGPIGDGPTPIENLIHWVRQKL